MFCNSCENAKGTLISSKCGSLVKMKGIAQCDKCQCAINRTGFAVIPTGRRPMTRKLRIFERRGRGAILAF